MNCNICKVNICDRKREHLFARYSYEFFITVIFITEFDCIKDHTTVKTTQ